VAVVVNICSYMQITFKYDKLEEAWEVYEGDHFKIIWV